VQLFLARDNRTNHKHRRHGTNRVLHQSWYKVSNGIFLQTELQTYG
jgi:uncharacterized protein with NRDE domain